MNAQYTLRGGSFIDSGLSSLCSAYRLRNSPDNSDDNVVGFRLARDAPPGTAPPSPEPSDSYSDDYVFLDLRGITAVSVSSPNVYVYRGAGPREILTWPTQESAKAAFRVIRGRLEKLHA